MAETAMHLADEVLPAVPIRQWVLSFPMAQRFGSALNLNLHFHALVLDGVYASASPFERPVFHPAEPLTDRDVAWIDYPPKSSPKARSFCRNT